MTNDSDKTVAVIDTVTDTETGIVHVDLDNYGNYPMELQSARIERKCT